MHCGSTQVVLIVLTDVPPSPSDFPLRYVAVMRWSSICMPPNAATFSRLQVQVRGFVCLRPHGVGAPGDDSQVRLRGPEQERRIVAGRHDDYRSKR